LNLSGYRLASRATASDVGERRSLLSGAGGEFRDFRPYEAGDEPRFVDWNIYARTGKLFVRQFHAERATRVYFVLDTSASMQERLVEGREILGFLARFARQDRIEQREIATLTHLNQLAREKPGLIVLLSDGLEPLPTLRPVLAALAARRFDLSWLQLLSQDDLDPPTGPWRISDRESGATHEVDDGARRQYLARLQRHLTALAALLASLRFRHVRLHSGDPLALRWEKLRRAGIVV
jgi:uncharacterized protein (DUF58 family)